MPEIDHDYTTEITCPYCGHKVRDSWEYTEALEDGDTELIQCGECERDFLAELSVSVSYSTQVINEISFLDEFIPMLNNGTKTLTRRPKTNKKPHEIGDILRVHDTEIYLRVQAVTQEFLQNIHPDDLPAEGFARCDMAGFIELWDSIYAEKGLSFASNPLVMAYKFRRVQL
jgi:transcription elongation factor Elf1